MKNHWFWGQTKNFAKSTIGFVESLIDNNHEVFSGKIAFKQFHFLLHPDPILEVLQKKDKYFKKSFAYDGLADFLGKGLLTNEGEDWLEKRRMIQPVFSKKSMDGLKGLIQSTSQNVLDNNVGKRVDLQAFMIEMITEIISQILFSEEESNMDGDELMDLLFTLRNHANSKLKNPFKLPLYIPTKENNSFKEAHLKIRNYIEGKVLTRLSSQDKKEDILQWLCDLHVLNPESISVKQLTDELITLYIAGQETTSNALTFIVHQIESNPEVKEKLLLNSDDYLKATIREGLRMFPPAWAVSREALEDIRIGSVDVKKGDTVFVSIYAMHRHKEYWQEPNVFQPDRFLDPEGRKNVAYLPFGKGSRFCIGNHLAMLEMEIVLRQLYGYDVSMDHKPLELITPMTLSISNAIHIKYL